MDGIIKKNLADRKKEFGIGWEINKQRIKNWKTWKNDKRSILKNYLDRKKMWYYLDWAW